MARKKIVFNINLNIAVGLYFPTVDYIRDAISNALTNGGFIVNNINISYSYVGDTYNVIAVTLAEDFNNDETWRLYAQNLISRITQSINYGLFTGSNAPMFNSVTVQVVESIPTNITATELANQNSILGQLGLDSSALSSGLGFSSPIAIAGLAVFLLFYLKR